jgi:hypothetical protein
MEKRRWSIEGAYLACGDRIPGHPIPTNATSQDANMQLIGSHSLRRLSRVLQTMEGT